MSTMKALLAMHEVGKNPELATKALAFFLARFPELADQSMGRDIVVINVPRRIADVDGCNGWNAATIEVKQADIDAVFRYISDRRKVEAIKALRAATTPVLDLKTAKDAVEYLSENQGKFQ